MSVELGEELKYVPFHQVKNTIFLHGWEGRKCGQPGKAERRVQWHGPVPQRLFLLCNIYADSWGLQLISPRGPVQVQQQLRVYHETSKMLPLLKKKSRMA